MTRHNATNSLIDYDYEMAVIKAQLFILVNERLDRQAAKTRQDPRLRPSVLAFKRRLKRQEALTRLKTRLEYERHPISNFIDNSIMAILDPTLWFWICLLTIVMSLLGS